MLLSAVELQLFGEAIDEDGEDDSDQRAETHFVAGRDDQVEGDGVLEVDEIVDGEVAGGGVPGDEGIGEEREGGLGGGENAAEVLVLFFEHLLPEYLELHLRL